MSALLSFVGWTFLPGLATDFIHTQLVTRFPDRFAPPGTETHAKNQRRIYIAVVVSYLAYTLYVALTGLEPNYYHLLQVPLDIDDKTLRSRFRRLSAMYHPDKGGNEHQFRTMRTAYDILSNPIKRFAYDRFGSQIINWEKAATYHDFMELGFKTTYPFYVASAFFIVGLSWLQKVTYGTYWRALALLFVANIHAVICMNSERLRIFRVLLPERVQFEHASICQSVAVVLLIAISQVGPALFPPVPDSMDGEILNEMSMIAKVSKAEAEQSLQIAQLPFVTGSTITNSLRQKTVDWILKQQIDSDPEVQQALQSARQRLTSVNQ